MLTIAELTKSPDLATQHHAELTAPGRPHQRYSLPNSTSSMHAHDSGTYQVSRSCNAASCRADGSRQAAPTLQSAQQQIPMPSYQNGTYQVSRSCNAASCRADGSRQAAPTLQSAQQHILNACSR